MTERLAARACIGGCGKVGVETSLPPGSPTSLAATLPAVEAGLVVWDETGAQQPIPTRRWVMVCAPAAADDLLALWQVARREH